MKNENTSFGLLTATILAGVALACIPSANSNNLANESAGLAGLTAYVANASDASVNVVRTTIHPRHSSAGCAKAKAEAQKSSEV